VTATVPAAAGVGLRFPHHGAALEPTPGVGWLEVHPENYLDDAGARSHLLRARERLPISLHAVGLSLGSAEGVSADALQRLRALATLVEPGLVSDHLSFSTVAGQYLPDLFPLPCTTEALAVVAANVAQAQDALGRRLLIENPSVYLAAAGADLGEAEFLAALVKQTGCGILLDVNNVHVTGTNTAVPPSALLAAFLEHLPAGAVGEIHLAGHATLPLNSGGQVLIDDHGSRVCPAVWALYRQALVALGPVPTLVEWDTAVPAWEVLAGEAQQAQQYLDALRAGDMP
jgi:uncharacterized protein (UPF0276 family)